MFLVKDNLHWNQNLSVIAAFVLWRVEAEDGAIGAEAVMARAHVGPILDKIVTPGILWITSVLAMIEQKNSAQPMDTVPKIHKQAEDQQPCVVKKHGSAMTKICHQKGLIGLLSMTGRELITVNNHQHCIIRSAARWVKEFVTNGCLSIGAPVIHLSHV